MAARHFIISGLLLGCGLTAHSASAAFDPNTISGLQVWLKADSINTGDSNQVRQSGADFFVKSWAHANPAGPDATQGTDASQPKFIAASSALNGQPAVRFDNSNDQMLLGDLSSKFPTGATVFIVTDVGRTDAAAGNDDAYNIYTTRSSGADLGWWRWNGDGNGYITTFRSNRIEQYPAAMPNNGAHILQADNTTGLTEIYVDGTSKGAQGNSVYEAGTDHRLSLGWAADNFFGGDIAEVLVYDTVLTSTQRGDVGSYLESKYGLNTAYVPEPAALCLFTVAGSLSLRRRVR